MVRCSCVRACVRVLPSLHSVVILFPTLTNLELKPSCCLQRSFLLVLSPMLKIVILNLHHKINGAVTDSINKPNM